MAFVTDKGLGSHEDMECARDDLPPAEWGDKVGGCPERILAASRRGDRLKSRRDPIQPESANPPASSRGPQAA